MFADGVENQSTIYPERQSFERGLRKVHDAISWISKRRKSSLLSNTLANQINNAEASIKNPFKNSKKSIQSKCGKEIKTLKK